MNGVGDRNKKPIGAHRVIHIGNAALSFVVFLLTLVLALVALDPSESHHILSERHRTPLISKSGTELTAWFTPVLVNAHNWTVAVIPASSTALAGARDVDRKLRHFFSQTLRLAVDSSTRVQQEKPLVTDAVATPASLLVALVKGFSEADSPAANLAEPAGDTPSLTTKLSEERQLNVLHFCSALSCTSPFLLQEWSKRGTAATAIQRSNAKEKTPNRQAKDWRRVQNFCLVFGNVNVAEALTRELSEQHVLVATTDSLEVAGDVVMPLIGQNSGKTIVASCSPDARCDYASSLKQERARHQLDSEALSLTHVASAKRVRAAWTVRQRAFAENASSGYARVRHVSFPSVLFDQQYALSSLPLDIVYMDAAGEDSVAVFTYLESLLTLAVEGVGDVSLPQHVVVTLYPSEWAADILHVMEQLEMMRYYTIFPLVNTPTTTTVDKAGDENSPLPSVYDDFPRWRDAQEELFDEAYVTTTYFSRSRVSTTPAAVLVLSRVLSSPAQLKEALASEWKGSAPAASTPEYFFFDSLALTTRDEVPLRAFFDNVDALEKKGKESSGVGWRVLGFVAQYIYFLIPLTVAGVLVWSLCRPRKAR